MGDRRVMRIFRTVLCLVYDSSLVVFAPKKYRCQFLPSPPLLFGASPAAYGSSQARSQIGAAALQHSLNSARSELHPWPTHRSSLQCWILNPHQQGKGWNPQPHGSSRVLNPMNNNRNSQTSIYCQALLPCAFLFD